MSTHKAPNKSNTRVLTKEMELALLRTNLYGIQQDAEFLREWGHLDNHALAKAAFDMEMLGFKLRHMLWLRNHADYQGN